jgi:hypothetical protein
MPGKGMFSRVRTLALVALVLLGAAALDLGGACQTGCCPGGPAQPDHGCRAACCCLVMTDLPRSAIFEGATPVHEAGARQATIPARAPAFPPPRV